MQIEQALRESLDHLIKQPPSRPSLVIIKRLLWAIIIIFIFNVFTSWQILYYDIKMADFFKEYILIRLPTLCFELFIAYHLVGIFSSTHYQKRYRLYQRYFDKNLANFTFSNKDFKEAAEALRNFKPTIYENAVKLYGQAAVDLLFLTLMIDNFEGKKFRRIVSLKAIEENRPADERDDQD